MRKKIRTGQTGTWCVWCMVRTRKQKLNGPSPTSKGVCARLLEHPLSTISRTKRDEDHLRPALQYQTSNIRIDLHGVGRDGFDVGALGECRARAIRALPRRPPVCHKHPPLLGGKHPSFSLPSITSIRGIGFWFPPSSPLQCLVSTKCFCALLHIVLVSL